MKMVKVGKWIAKHRILMLIIGFLLIIPSVIGMAATKVNYDLLSYLPEHLETVKGQDILVPSGAIFHRKSQSLRSSRSPRPGRSS